MMVSLRVYEQLQVLLPDGQLVTITSDGQVTIEQSKGSLLDMAELLTVKQTAAVLGLSRSRVYQLFASGELSSKKVGKSRRVSRTALEEFIKTLPDLTEAQYAHTVEV